MDNNHGAQPLLDLIRMKQMRRVGSGFDPRASSSTTSAVRPEGLQDDLAGVKGGREDGV